MRHGGGGEGGGQRVKRNLFIITSMASLLLCAASVVLWARSEFAVDEILIRSQHSDLWLVSFVSARGSVAIFTDHWSEHFTDDKPSVSLHFRRYDADYQLSLFSSRPAGIDLEQAGFLPDLGSLRWTRPAGHQRSARADGSNPGGGSDVALLAGRSGEAAFAPRPLRRLRLFPHRQHQRRMPECGTGARGEGGSMRRKLFAFAAALSLLLFGATVVLWVRSISIGDEFFVATGRKIVWHGFSARGEIELHCFAGWPDSPGVTYRTQRVIGTGTQPDAHVVAQCLTAVPVAGYCQFRIGQRIRHAQTNKWR